MSYHRVATHQDQATGRVSAYLIPPLTVLLSGLALSAILFAHDDVRALADPGPVAEPGTWTQQQDPDGAGPQLSPIFRPEVLYWRQSIIEWSKSAGVDPNFAAVVMQIESCGNPNAVSRSGALGLFQVMPFHFLPGESGLDPDTNAARGLAYLARSLELSGGDPRRALAGYNGGLSVIGLHEAAWSEQTRRYVRYGLPIFEAAMQGEDASDALGAWYAQLGVSLCRQAAAQLGLR
jgi:hypothetical protein